VQPAAARLERVLELAHALPDELDAPVAAAGQKIEYLGVEDESAVHCTMRAQRGVQCGVVRHTQVAAEPDQRGGIQWHALKYRQACPRSI
jgi:hypothetical protein